MKLPHSLEAQANLTLSFVNYHLSTSGLTVDIPKVNERSHGFLIDHNPQLTTVGLISHMDYIPTTLL